VRFKTVSLALDFLTHCVKLCEGGGIITE